MAETPVSVLVVDDQAPFRRAASEVVVLTNGFEMVVSESGEEAETMVDALSPRPRPHGHQHARHRRHRGDPPDQGRAPRGGRGAAVDLHGGRPPDGRPHGGAAAYVNKEDFGPTALRELAEESGLEN